jgi:hypothetical protein
MTNFTIQTLLGLPKFFLVFLVLILTLKTNKLRVNNFFICGSLLAFAEFISNELFWVGEPDVSSLSNFVRFSNILFSSTFLLFLYGVLQTILEINSLPISRKRNVWSLLFLTLITLGFYVPFWYIENYLKHKAGNFLIVIFAFFLTSSFFAHLLLYQYNNTIGLAIWLTLDILTFLLSLILILKLRATIIKENPEIEINLILTFLFGIFYVQYQINQLDEI